MTKSSRIHLIYSIILLLATNSLGASLDIYVVDEKGKEVRDVSFLCVETGEDYYESNGHLHIDDVVTGAYRYAVNADFFKEKLVYVTIESSSVVLNVTLESAEIIQQDTVEIKRYEKQHLGDVHDDKVIGSKKAEITNVDDLVISKGNPKANQLFQKSPLTNVIETDGAGLQLGIGGRGLDPHRSSNFNIRQNGYDISADALGYPESYYTPAVEAVSKIEVLRGAASLQYGTQFGGVVNFKLRSGYEQPFQIISRQTVGSFRFLNSYNSVGGTTKKRIKYFAYYQHKSGNDYRPNSEFKVHNMFGHIEFPVGEKLQVGLDQTYMTYLAHQPGGLTDYEFETDPLQSNRDRNWFEVKWYVPALTLNYFPSPNVFISSKFFGLLAERNSVGNLGLITRVDDPNSARNVINGTFKNGGNETRLVFDYKIKDKQSYLATGFKLYYSGNTSVQGYGDSNADANFDISDTSEIYSSYTFPNKNYSAFIENIFYINKKLSIVPGLRLEHINTSADGYYRTQTTDLAGNDIQNYLTNENINLPRTFLIAGLGASYKLLDSINTCEMYTNATQNYRSVTYSDIRVNNPSLVIDSAIHDEKGYNFDLGIRAEKPEYFNIDVSGFVLIYDDRIGEVWREFYDPVRLNVIKRYRTNISDALVYGVEAFGEANVMKIFRDSSATSLSVFLNTAVIRAEYVNSTDLSVLGKEVEYAPRLNVKTGLVFKRKKIGSSLQFSYTSDQYSDASNADEHVDATFGIIPAYYLLDWSMFYKISDHFKFEGGVNNFTNNSYFTVRASGYPGPGILPSSGRNFFVTLECKLK